MFKEYDNIQIRIDADKFNSGHFGMQMGNMDISLTDRALPFPAVAQALAAGIADAKREGFQHLTCKINPGMKSIIYGLQKQNFLLVDTLVTYYFDLKKGQCPVMTHRCKLGDCRAEDVAYLKQIAKESFKIDRFHSDPSLPNNLCDQYYENWFENSWHGYADKIVVGYLDDVPAGFATAKYTKGEPYIHAVLAAVAAKARGNGIYNSMKWAELQWAVELAKQNPNIQGIINGTQINNIAAQRSWIKCGYTFQGSMYIFQRKI